MPDGPDQLWVADLTYVAVMGGFVYVAIILERHPIMLDHMRRSLRRRDSGGIRLA